MCLRQALVKGMKRLVVREKPNPALTVSALLGNSPLLEHLRHGGLGAWWYRADPRKRESRMVLFKTAGENVLCCYSNTGQSGGVNWDTKNDVPG